MKVFRRPFALVATLAAPLVLGCSDSPTGPARDRSILALGDSIEASLGGSDSLIYHATLQQGQSIAVHLWGVDGPFSAALLDSTRLAYARSYASITGGVSAQWSPLTVPRSGTYSIVVRRGTGGTGGKFALRLLAVPTAPERASAVIQFGDTVSSESIDGPDDIDDFTFDATAGQRIEIFFQALSPTTIPPQAGLFAESGGAIVRTAQVLFDPASSTEDLEMRGAGPIDITSSGRYHLRFQNTTVVSSRSAYAGPYRFMVYAVDTRPERAAAAITPGDTIAESIDHVGDLDTFTLTAAPGKQFNLFAASEGDAPHAIAATVYGDDSATVGARARIYPAPALPLIDQASGRFTMPASGSLRIVVGEQHSGVGLFRGPYRLLVYPIDSMPEGRPATLVPSGTPIDGAIDMLGDIDVYDFTLDSTRRLEIRTDWASELSNILQYEVDGATGPVDDLNAVPPGSYHLWVRPIGTGQTGSYRGRYRIALAPVLLPTEHASAALVTNDTVKTETLAWPADADTFNFAPAVPDTVVFELLRPPGDSSWGRNVLLTDPAADLPLDTLGFWTGDRLQLPRVTLAPGQSVRVAVVGETDRWAPGTEGAYQLVARRVSAAPEHRSPDIALGDTVRDSLDYGGDIDDYVLRGPPGQEIAAQALWAVNYGRPLLTVSLIDPTTDSVLTVADAQPIGMSANTHIPASGTLRVRACVGAQCEVTSHDLRRYWFAVRAIDRAPETRAATFALGDTVSEPLADPTDVDEFPFSGTAGDRLTIAFQWLSTEPSVLSPGLALDVVDAGTDSTVATLISNGTQIALDDVSATVTVPRTGSYLVRVHAHHDTTTGWEVDQGDYRFRVTATP